MSADKQRVAREQEALRRADQERVERKRREEVENRRQKEEYERRRWDEMVRAKQVAKVEAETKAAELKQDSFMKDLETKKENEDRATLNDTAATNQKPSST